MSILTESSFYSTIENSKEKARARALFSRLIQKMDERAALQQVCTQFAQICTERTTLAHQRFEPTEEEIRKEIRRLKNLGLIHEIPEIPEERANVHELSKKRTTLAHQCVQGFDSNYFSDLVKFVIVGILTFTITYLLVKASVSVLGTDITGWSKAVILEASIIGLAVFTPKKILQKLFVKATLIALITASFLVLHTGVETERTEGVSKSTYSDLELKNLQESRKKLVESHDSLPKNFHTKKEKLIFKISEIDNKISAKIKELKSSDSFSSKVVNLQSDLEMTLRVLFLSLNLIFSHIFVVLLSKIYHPTFTWISSTLSPSVTS